MGQVLHGSATTTEAVRRAIQARQESVRAAAKRYGISATTVQKWRSRQTSTDARMGPKEPRSSVLSLEDEAVIVAFRRHTLLPLDDCLYALQPTLPHLTRSSLHRCLQRHGISRLPEVDGERVAPRPSSRANFFHIDLAEVRTSRRNALHAARDRPIFAKVKNWLKRRKQTEPRSEPRAPVRIRRRLVIRAKHRRSASRRLSRQSHCR
jgi:transposase